MSDGRHSDVFRYVMCDVLTVAGRLIIFVRRKPHHRYTIDGNAFISSYRFAVDRADVIVLILSYFRIHYFRKH